MTNKWDLKATEGLFTRPDSESYLSTLEIHMWFNVLCYLLFVLPPRFRYNLTKQDGGLLIQHTPNYLDPEQSRVSGV